MNLYGIMRGILCLKNYLQRKTKKSPFIFFLFILNIFFPAYQIFKNLSEYEKLKIILYSTEKSNGRFRREMKIIFDRKLNRKKMRLKMFV